MNALPVGPFAWWWAVAGVGFTLTASCLLMPWVVWEELARQDREDTPPPKPNSVVAFRKPAA